MPSIRSNRSAALGPVFTDSHTTDVNVQAVLRGPQDTGVTTGEADTGPHVAVRIGRVLVYCYDEDAVARHVAAWRQAQTRAARSFPDGYTAPLPHTSTNSLSVGSAVLHIAGEPDYELRSGKPPAVPEPFVRVQVGQLTTVALDAAAVTTTLAAWAKAEQTAEDLFNPDPDNLTPNAIRAFEHAARLLPRSPS